MTRKEEIAVKLKTMRECEKALSDYTRYKFVWPWATDEPMAVLRRKRKRLERKLK